MSSALKLSIRSYLYLTTMANLYSPGKCLIKNHLPQNFRNFPHCLFTVTESKILNLLIIFFYFPDKYVFGDNDTHCSRVWPACLFFCINTIQQKKRTQQMIDDQPCDLNFLLALKIRVSNFIFLKWLFCDRFVLISFYFVAEWVWFPSTFLQKKKNINTLLPEDNVQLFWLCFLNEHIIS